MRKILLSFVLMLGFVALTPATVSAQVVTNPTAVEFTCPDHDLDSNHELKILRVEGTNKIIVTTILLGDIATYKDAATKLVAFTMNVQPIAFGNYVATVRVVASTAGGPVYSADSEESNPFQRVPGGPGKPKIGGGFE